MVGVGALEVKVLRAEDGRLVEGALGESIWRVGATGRAWRSGFDGD